MSIKKSIIRLVAIFAVVLSLNSCIKDSGDTPCTNATNICIAAKEEDKSGKTFLDITWNNSRNINGISYTVFIKDQKTNEVLFEDKTTKSNIIVPFIPEYSFKLIIITHPCEEEDTVQARKIIVGDIQCFP